MGKHELNPEFFEGKNVKARLVNAGKIYSTYSEFADAIGFPTAVANRYKGDEKSARARKLEGEVVSVLAKGSHMQYKTENIYVIQAKSGETFLIGATGIEIIIEEAVSIGIIEQMQAEIDDLKAKVSALEERRTTIRIDGKGLTAESTVVKSPQQCRDETVEMAKKDVKELVTRGLDSSTSDRREGSLTHRLHFYVVSFNVNTDKRAVTAIVKTSSSCGNPIGEAEVGIAKCAPNDCFNVHIGKAIALRRALGLDVPAEYYSAPQPEEVRVGDVVGFPFDPNDDSRDVICKIDTGRAYCANGEFYSVNNIFGKGEPLYDPYIIDDSREEVGE